MFKLSRETTYLGLQLTPLSDRRISIAKGVRNFVPFIVNWVWFDFVGLRDLEISGGPSRRKSER